MSNEGSAEAMNDADETLDLVDENDNVIGTIARSETSAGQLGGYIRASELLIINDKGQLWIPRRQMNKRIAPGGLDFSAAGHVSSGETYEETLKKEVAEEINLELDDSKLEFLHKFTPRPDLPPYFRSVWLYRSNDAPNYNPDDFSGYEWLDPHEMLRRIKDGDPAKESLTETIEYLVDHI
jgi:isopentenyl-diphosphate delta-isomerase